MRESSIKVGRILTKYEQISGVSFPDTVELDFKNIVMELPSSVLKPHIAVAFSSSATPAVPEIVASWYKKAKKADRARLLRLLRESGAIPVEIVPPVRDPDVELISGDEIARVISSAIDLDPGINEMLAGIYAHAPKSLGRRVAETA